MSRLTRNVFLKLTLFAGLSFLAMRCHATDVAYTGIFQGTEGPASFTGLASTKTFTRDMNTTGDRVSFQINYSSYTGAATQTFTDGSTSTGTITVSSNSYVQASTPTITISGISIFYTPGASAGLTAQSISSAILNTASFNTVLVSTFNFATGVVTATSTFIGTSANFNMTSSSQAALGVSGATMTGGTNSAYVINTPTITIASNGFVAGMAVLYSTTSAQAIGGLTNQTTYYIGIVSPNTLGQSSKFVLATSSANAIVGTGIVLTSSQTKTTADTFKLAPLAFTNTSNAGLQLQWSDDKVNWVNLTTGNYNAAISSVTFTNSGTTATVLYDLGAINHRYLRLNEVPPTTGSATFTAIDNERYSFKH